MSIFSSLLNSAMREKGFRTVSSLARATGVDASNMRKYLAGDKIPRLETQIKIASALDLNVFDEMRTAILVDYVTEFYSGEKNMGTGCKIDHLRNCPCCGGDLPRDSD